jgi:hypothetical protein
MLNAFRLGLLSLFVFGVTLEALNDPKELSDIPFKPWDFFTYGLIALGVLLQPAIHSRLVDEWQRPIQSSKINAKVEDPIVLSDAVSTCTVPRHANE